MSTPASSSSSTSQTVSEQTRTLLEDINNLPLSIDSTSSSPSLLQSVIENPLPSGSEPILTPLSLESTAVSVTPTGLPTPSSSSSSSLSSSASFSLPVTESSPKTKPRSRATSGVSDEPTLSSSLSSSSSLASLSPSLTSTSPSSSSSSLTLSADESRRLMKRMKKLKDNEIALTKENDMLKSANAARNMEVATMKTMLNDVQYQLDTVHSAYLKTMSFVEKHQHCETREQQDQEKIHDLQAAMILRNRDRTMLLDEINALKKENALLKQNEVNLAMTIDHLSSKILEITNVQEINDADRNTSASASSTDANANTPNWTKFINPLSLLPSVSSPSLKAPSTSSSSSSSSVSPSSSSPSLLSSSPPTVESFSLASNTIRSRSSSPLIVTSSAAVPVAAPTTTTTATTTIAAPLPETMSIVDEHPSTPGNVGEDTLPPVEETASSSSSSSAASASASTSSPALSAASSILSSSNYYLSLPFRLFRPTASSSSSSSSSISSSSSSTLPATSSSGPLLSTPSSSSSKPSSPSTSAPSTPKSASSVAPSLHPSLLPQLSPSSMVVEEVWENERFIPLIGWQASSWPLRAHWSNESGTVAKPSLSTFPLEEGWKWQGQWCVVTPVPIKKHADDAVVTDTAAVAKKAPDTQDSTSSGSEPLEKEMSVINSASFDSESTPTSTTTSSGSLSSFTPVLHNYDDGYQYSSRAVFSALDWHVVCESSDQFRRRRWLRVRVRDDVAEEEKRKNMRSNSITGLHDIEEKVVIKQMIDEVVTNVIHHVDSEQDALNDLESEEIQTRPNEIHYDNDDDHDDNLP